MIYSNKYYQRDLIRKGFYQNRDEHGRDYNYDLKELIDDFDFYDFIDYAEKYKEELQDYGAFIVITNKQYIIGYNASYGTGTHLSAFARVMKELNGGGYISSSEEARTLTEECTKKFLTGRIMYERCETYGRPKLEGHISFNLVGIEITNKQLEVFTRFNEAYGTEIRRLSNKYGMEKFKIIITYKNQEGILDSLETNNLDDVYSILQNYISEEKILEDENERIIGVDCQSKQLIKQL